MKCPKCETEMEMNIYPMNEHLGLEEVVYECLKCGYEIEDGEE